MAKDIQAAVREICLSFPDAEEVISHGSPNFRVNGKAFATFTVNHHGDGRVALNVFSPAGAQQLYTEMEPGYYFVPPYVGPRGWLGMELNRGLDWSTIARRTREAYENVAPATLIAGLGATIEIEPPDVEMTAEQIDPFLGARAQQVMAKLKELCDALPETSQATQFGNPVWKAGKKTFVSSHYHSGRLKLQFRVGVEQQAFLTYEERYQVPAYTGHNGWIDLDVEEHADWQEIEGLLMVSYRHFALKRMLKAIGEC